MRRLMPIFLAVATLVPVAAALPGTAQAGAVEKLNKIAVVDAQRCIMETTQGRQAKKKLERAFSKANARFEKKAKALQSEYQDLQAKAALLSEPELQRRAVELQRKQAELEQLLQKSQADLARDEALLTEKIYKNVAAIAKQIALEEGVQVVLVKSESTVLYANPKLDLTNRVIVAYDKKHK